MSNQHEFSDFLNDVKGNIDNPSDEIRKNVINEGLSSLKSRISGMDIQVSREVETVEEEITPHWDNLSLADATRNLYRESVKPKERKVEEPNTIAKRANTRARIQSMTGSGSSGNTGKPSPVPPGGSGNQSSGCGMEMASPVYVEDSEESLDDYKARIFESFGLDEGTAKDKKGSGSGTKDACYHKVKSRYSVWPSAYASGALVKCRKAGADNWGNSSKKEEVEYVVEDAVSILEDELLEMDRPTWQKIDKVMRQICQENNMTPKELHKDFKRKHGMIPDEWVKKNQQVESVGYFPLDEMTRINKVGQLYDVTFMFRGGTQRFKFFWPQAKRPSKAEMQQAVELFYPKARLLTYYPSLEQDDNYMVIVPPMTENYEVVPEDYWMEMSEESSDTFNMICEEVGEPLGAVTEGDDGNYEVVVEDHDTGEEIKVVFGEGSLHAWFGKSKSKGGKPGWVQSDGSPCANEKGETKTPKCYSSRRLAGLKKTEEGKKKIRSADARKSRQDSGQQQKGGAAKPTNVRTFTDKKDYKKHPSGDYHKHEEFVPEACWAGYEQKGMKTMFGKKYPNCVKKSKTKKEEVEYIEEKGDMSGLTQKGGHKRSTESGAGLMLA